MLESAISQAKAGREGPWRTPGSSSSRGVSTFRGLLEGNDAVRDFQEKAFTAAREVVKSTRLEVARMEAATVEQLEEAKVPTPRAACAVQLGFCTSVIRRSPVTRRMLSCEVGRA